MTSIVDSLDLCVEAIVEEESDVSSYIAISVRGGWTASSLPGIDAVRERC